VRGAFRFGLELGTGVRTYVPPAAPYILLLAILLGGLTLRDALLIAMGFGVGRAIPVMVAVGAGERVQTAFDFLRRSDAPAMLIAGLVVLVGGMSLV
jgi:hypothetical protein